MKLSRFFCLLSLLAGAAFAQPSVSTVFTGAGLNGATVSGVWTGSVANHQIVVTISATGAPDQFTWALDGGAVSTAVPVVACSSTAAVTGGLSMCWTATTGHTLGAPWVITVTAPGSVHGYTTRPGGIGALPVASDTAISSIALNVMGFCLPANVNGTTDNTGCIQEAWTRQ